MLGNCRHYLTFPSALKETDPTPIGSHGPVLSTPIPATTNLLSVSMD